jgi:hypothetical protein
VGSKQALINPSPVKVSEKSPIDPNDLDFFREELKKRI